jgi:hypothetical protein
MIEHIAELRGGDRDNTISRRRPDEPTTFQTLGIQRHTQAVMPKDFQQVAATSAKHVEITSEWICGAPHIRSYVSDVIMWRRRRVVREFAATGGLSRHIIRCSPGGAAPRLLA